MGYISTNGNGNGSISGTSVAHRRLNQRARVQLAADVASGDLQYVPTKREIAVLCRVHPSQLSKELRERKERIKGRADKDKQAVMNLTSWWEAASDSALDEAVLKIGVKRVWDVVERLTR